MKPMKEKVLETYTKTWQFAYSIMASVYCGHLPISMVR